MTGVHALRFAAAPGHGPDGLLRSRRIARGIRVLSRCVLSFAAHVDDRVAIRGKAQARQFLPVILAVFCDLPGRESGAFGHPDISPAFLVQYPRDAIALLCSSQIRWEWRAQDLFQRKRLLRVGLRNQK